jgi:hypothetical protein
MRNFRKYLRIISAIAGIILIAGGVYAAYWWYYRAAPYRKMYDPNWCRQHSALAYWQAFLSSYKREDWPHDAFSVGAPGDKDYMASLITRIKPSDEISECHFGHLDHLFPYITNHDFGKDTKAWLTWWKANQEKSQEEWIVDGFAARGIAVTTQLQDSTTIPLLELLGNTDTNEACRIPHFVKFNAFRWLRDSGFEPVQYAVSNLTSTTSLQQKQGLVAYAKLEQTYPKRDGLGILSFGRAKDSIVDRLKPAMLETRFLAAIYSAIYVAPLLGIILLALAIKTRSQAPE